MLKAPQLLLKALLPLSLAALLLTQIGCAANGSILDMLSETNHKIISLSVVDGNYSASLASSPTLTWETCPSSSDRPEVQISRLADSAVVKTWQQGSSGAAVSGLSLVAGLSYCAEVRCVSSAGEVTATGTGDGWTVVTGVALSPSSVLSMITGEGLTFMGVGGAPTYSFQDSGSGYLNSITGVYGVPLGIAPTTDSVKVTDGISQQSGLTSITIRTFQDKQQLSSAISGNHTFLPSAVIEHNSVLLAADTITYYSGGAITKPSAIGIFKSTDGGSTWTLVSQHQPYPGVSASKGGLTSVGTKVYLHGVMGSDGIFLSESSDNGATWTLDTTYRFTGASSVAGLSNPLFIPTADNSVLFGSDSISPYSYVLRKCNLATWICATVDSGSSGSTTNITRLVQDGAGGFYITARVDSTVYIKKSTNNGATWAPLRTDSSGSNSILSLAVSSDGQTILYGGVSGGSFAYLQESSDGGSTFTNVSSFCSTAWRTLDIVMNSSKDVMVYCYDFTSGSATYVTRRPFGGSWSTLITTATNAGTGGGFSKKANGDILFLHAGEGTLRTTANFGTTWTSLTFPTTTMSAAGDAEFSSIIQNSSGHLFAAGSITVSAGTRNAAIYKSTDNGATWSSDYSIGSGFSNFVSLAKSPTTNNLIALGNQDGTKWIAHKYTAGTWALSESYVPGSFSTVGSVFSSSSGDFYAVGGIYVSFVYHWLVRVSTNDGASWTQLDDFQYASGMSSQALAGVADGTDIYVGGKGADAGGKYHWLIRKYSGSTWTIDDDDTFITGVNSSATVNAMTRAANGTLYAVGEYTQSGAKHWVVKKKVSGGSWTLVDDFNLDSGFNSAALGITEDADKRILVSGYGIDATGARYGLIRTLVTSGGGASSTWRTVDKYASFGYGTTASLVPCLTSRVCAAGSSIDSLGMLRGFIRILSP